MLLVVAVLVFATQADTSSSAQAPPKNCKEIWTRGDFHKVAQDAYDGKYKASSKEQRIVKEAIRCQDSAKSRKNVREHQVRYRKSHIWHLYNQGVGKLNRIFPEHSLSYALALRCSSDSLAYLIPYNTLRRGYEAVGATPVEAARFATIARGEGGGGCNGAYAGIRGDDPGGTKGWGPTQNTPGVWDTWSATYRKMIYLGGTVALRNPLVGGAVSLTLLRTGGWSNWVGTRFWHQAQAITWAKSVLTRADKRWIKAGGRLRLGR